MTRFEPGCQTEGTMRHEFWEEVWILSGSLHDLRLGQTFTTGMYACRPPGMPHGPWRSDDGCVTFEVRYTSGSSG
jgi:8-oxo-dGTP pyrophosphatase MutT (NUDIX family)